MNHEPGRILVIDDDCIFCQLLSVFLVKAGYEVLTAPDGLTAIEMLDSFQPDLIFLDLCLPVLSGWEFLEQYRPCQPIPIIASSAGHVNATTLGDGVIYLSKPFKLESLLQIVETALSAGLVAEYPRR